MTKWVYSFGTEACDGDASLRNLLGGKGANLAEMAALGLPVPPGFTITTEVCTYYYDHGHSYPDALNAQVEAALTRIEAETGRKFSDVNNPLLLSVRSGARASMPGMMDTVLNLGLNDASVAGLAVAAVTLVSPMIAIAVLFRCMVMWFCMLIMACLRMRWKRSSYRMVCIRIQN